MYKVKGKTSNNFKFTINVDDDYNCNWKLKDKSTGDRTIGKSITMIPALTDILNICENQYDDITFRMKVKIPMIIRTTKPRPAFQWRSTSDYHISRLNSGPAKTIKFSRTNNRDGNIYLLNTYLDGEILEDEVLISNDLTEAYDMLMKLIDDAMCNEEIEEEKKDV